MADCAGPERKTCRNLPLYLFLSEHASSGRSSGVVLPGNSLPDSWWLHAVAAAWLGNSGTRGHEAGAGRRILLRAIRLLSRLRAGYVSACPDSRRSQRSSHFHRLRWYFAAHAGCPVLVGTGGEDTEPRR